MLGPCLVCEQSSRHTYGTILANFCQPSKMRRRGSISRTGRMRSTPPPASAGKSHKETSHVYALFLSRVFSTLLQNVGGRSGMPPAMAAWASVQLRKINGKDDLTLLEFCMSLTDASEIRQYLAAYLGSTPEVCNSVQDLLRFVLLCLAYCGWQIVWKAYCLLH